MTLTVRTLLSTALAVLVTAGVPAQASAEQQSQPDRVHSVRRLGGPTRFVAPVRTVDALKRSMARPAIQKDLTTVLGQVGLSSIEAEVRRILAAGEVTEATLTTGTTLEWMARRRGRRPDALRNVRWDGKAPIEGYEFTIDDLNRTYTFFVPKTCGNLSLVRQEPSREAARRAEVARAEAARQEAARQEAARQEAARQEAARQEAARQEAARQEAARQEAARQEAARQAAARQAEEARKAEAARVEAARVEALRLAEERDLRLRPFIGGLFGKQHGRASVPAECGGCLIAGASAGLAMKLNANEKLTFAPAVGFASNLEEGGRVAVILDAPINYNFSNGSFVGSGITAWDIGHGDNRTFGWLVGAGVPVWKNDVRKHELQFVIEWRQMFTEKREPYDVRHMGWLGLRYLFK